MAPSELRNAPSYRKGMQLLAKPLWPLCNLMVLLYLTSEGHSLEELVRELPDEIDTPAGKYENPAELLGPVLPALKPMEVLREKGGGADAVPQILNVEGEPLDLFETVTAWIQQNVLEKELEMINSLLCGPCGCTLCCTGPLEEARQEFFEIPLEERELDLFDLPRVDTPSSRATSPEADEELRIDGLPFYKRPEAIYRWERRWSLVLPKGSACPHLNGSGQCGIYPERPAICRKPQIFPVVVEEQEKENDGKTLTRRDILLAVWDCPYVRDLKEEILEYASHNGLKVIFKENKA